MYATKSEFEALYPNDANGTYDKYSFMAQKALDNATSTIDGVKKLRIAFPTDEEDAETVKRCFCAVIHGLYNLDRVEAAGYAETANGIQPRVIKSISAGGESVTYETQDNEIVVAASSNAGRRRYINGLIDNYLRGTTDDNGVNLLFGGVYPRGLLDV